MIHSLIRTMDNEQPWSSWRHTRKFYTLVIIYGRQYIGCLKSLQINFLEYIYIYHILYIYSIYIYKSIQQDTPHAEQSGASQTSRINDNPWKIQPLAQDCLEGKPLISPIKAVSSGFCILYFLKADIYLIGLLLMNKQSEEKYKSLFTHEMRSFSKSLTKSKNTSISSVV